MGGGGGSYERCAKRMGLPGASRTFRLEKRAEEERVGRVLEGAHVTGIVDRGEIQPVHFEGRPIVCIETKTTVVIFAGGGGAVKGAQPASGAKMNRSGLFHQGAAQGCDHEFR